MDGYFAAHFTASFVASEVLWFRTTLNTGVSTGALTPSFAHSFALLTHLLTLSCSLWLCAPLHSFVCFFIDSRTRGKEVFVNDMNAWILFSFSPSSVKAITSEAIKEPHFPV